MDIRALLTFVATHVEQIIGGTLILFFATSLLLLIRSIGQSGGDDSATSGHESIDAQAVEDAVRRALGSTPLQIAAGDVSASAPVTVSDGNPAALEQYKKEVQKRDLRIEELLKELALVREQVKSATASGEGGAGAAISDTELKELKSKLEEFQARLSEYEIIEDDIADLSLFKEENARLKTEIETLNSRLADPGAASVVKAAPQSAPAPVGESAFARASSEPADPVLDDAPSMPPETAPTPEPTSVSESQDDVLREFAAAVEAQRAPPASVSSSLPFDAAAVASMTSATVAGSAAADDPQAAIDAMLAEAQSQIDAAAKAANTEPPPAVTDDVLTGSPDPDKMLAEVASLLAAEIEDTSALEENLDTDKLLAEVGKLDLSSPPSSEESDDLLAEFAGEATAKTSKG